MNTPTHYFSSHIFVYCLCHLLLPLFAHGADDPQRWLDRAQSEVRLIKDPNRANIVWEAIGRVHAIKGNSSEASTAISSIVFDDGVYSRPNVAALFLKVGIPDKALLLAAEGTALERDLIALSLTEWFAKTNRLPEAIARAKSIQSIARKEMATTAIATALVHAGKSEDAIALVKGIDSPLIQYNAMCDLAVAMASSGHALNAKNLLNSLTASDCKNRSLRQILEIEAKAGQADKVLMEAKNTSYAPWPILAQEFARAGDISKAYEVARMSREERHTSLMAIADIQMKQGDNAGAIKSIAEALGVAKDLPAEARCEAYLNILPIQYKADINGYRRTLVQYAELTRAQDDALIIDLLWLSLSDAQLACGDVDGATRSIQLIKSNIATECRIGVVNALIKTGRSAEARDYLNRESDDVCRLRMMCEFAKVAHERSKQNH